MTGAEKPPQLVMKEALDTIVETVLASAEEHQRHGRQHR